MGHTTIVDALYSNSGFWYIVVTPALCDSTYIVTVDTTTGNPFFTGIPFVDIFPDHSMALKKLIEIGAQQKHHGDGFIGLAQTDTSSTFAIVDRSAVTARFPDNHKIRTIKHATFVNIPIKGSNTRSSTFEEFQLNENHFFCDTYDLTRLYPVDGYDNPDLGFVWNNGFRKPFEKLGIPQICIYLIQGVCVSKEFINFKFSLTYMCRRSVLNPGTRYAARGLNDLNSPGNEVECELIFIKDKEFWSQSWRRGSIPIRWKTVLSSKLASPKHTVDKNDFFNGTCEYFQMLNERFGNVPIRCVSLLQTESDHAENEIKEYFTKALGQLFDHGVDNVFFTPFDLNQHLHADGSGEAMMDFLSYIAPLGDGDGFTHGVLPCTVQENQQGLMRFNCADSLDRTNLATFYWAMKITADWCKEKKVGLSKTPDADPNQPNLILHQSIIDFLANAFVNSGNVVSKLYTNTQAIKTNAIKRFSPTIVVSASDTNITLQRRMQNVVNDPARQKIIEAWTQPNPLQWFHRLDSRYMFMVPNENNSSPQFPRILLSNSNNQYDVQSKELTICLPNPMVLFAFMILMHPSNQRLAGVTLKGGMTLNDMKDLTYIPLPSVEQPIWLRYKPSNAARWGCEDPHFTYIRYLSFTFDCPDDKYAIGNILIEARSVYSEKQISVPAKQPVSDETNKEQFANSFEDFMKSPKTLMNSLELEKLRLSLNIQEEFRNVLAVKHCINPWLADSRAQIVAAPTFLCAFCNGPYGDMPKYFKNSSSLPGLIVKSSTREGSFQICPKCKDAAENIAQITQAYEEEMKLIELPVPHFTPGQINQDSLERVQAITNEATSSFLNCESSLLWSSGGSEKFQQDEEKEFDMFIFQQAIVLKLVAYATSDNFDIIDSSGNKLEQNRINENEIEFLFSEQPITQRLKFTIKAREELEITRLYASYIITEFPLEYPQVHKKESLKFIPFSFITAFYDVNTRTETFKIDRLAKVFTVLIEMVIEKGVPAPLSVYICLYKQNEFVDYRHLILPEVPHGSKLWYPISKEGIQADMIKVFYADRIPSLRPHVIKFVTQ